VGRRSEERDDPVTTATRWQASIGGLESLHSLPLSSPSSHPTRRSPCHLILAGSRPIHRIGVQQGERRKGRKARRLLLCLQNTNTSFFSLRQRDEGGGVHADRGQALRTARDRRPQHRWGPGCGRDLHALGQNEEAAVRHTHTPSSFPKAAASGARAGQDPMGRAHTKFKSQRIFVDVESLL
jgi:hypothetical protein